MQKYSTYKPSNVEWLGDVPSHWKVTRLINRTVQIVGGDWGDDPELESDEHVLLPVIRVQDIDNEYEISDQKLTDRKIKVSKIDHRLIDNKTLLIEKSGGGEKQLVGRVAIPKKITTPAICSNFMEKIEMDEQAVPSFFNYIFHALYNRNMNFPFVQQTTGIQNLKSTYYFYTKVAYPNPTEQTAIAAYLDQATANIDKVIATKQKQLEKLEQFKQSKIHECVTKGLNPDVPLKPSGIDWIEKMPLSWKVVRIKDVIESVLGGGTPSTTNPSFWEGDIPWVSPKDMKCELINKTEDYITEAGLKASATNLIPINTILIVVRSGILKHTLPVAINTVSVSLNQDMKGLVANTKMNFRFLYHTLSAFEKAILTQCTKQVATVDSIESKLLFGFKILLPSPKEQVEISNFIDELTFKINKEKSIIEQQIEKLKQYRKCLIHECVTGKRKVIND